MTRSGSASQREAAAWVSCRPTWFVLCAVVASASAGATEAEPSRSVAVLPLSGLGVSEGERVALEEELRASLATFGLQVQERATTAEALTDVQALGLQCDFGSVECLVRVGALGLSTLVLAGSASLTQDGYEIELQLVDVVAMAERGRRRVPVARAGLRRARDMEGALVSILRPDAWRGALVVEVPGRTAASVFVDNVPRGLTPLKGSIALAPGAHELVVSLDGFRSHREIVELVYGETTRVRVALVPGVAEATPVLRLPTEPPSPASASKDAARRGPLRVAFYDVQVLGVHERLGRVLGLYLVAELRKRERISIIDGDEVRALAGGPSASGTAADRCDLEGCFAEVAEALGADVVVVTQLTQTEGRIVLGLRRIDQRRQEVVASFVQTVAIDDEDALLPLVGESIAATFSDLPLRPGQAPGVEERALRVLHPPPVPPAVTVPLVVLAGVGALSSTVFGAITGKAYVDYHDSRDRAVRLDQGKDENGVIVEHARLFEGFLPIFVATSAVTAALVIGAGAAATVTDWHGDAAVVPEGP